MTEIQEIDFELKAENPNEWAEKVLENLEAIIEINENEYSGTIKISSSHCKTVEIDIMDTEIVNVKGV